LDDHNREHFQYADVPLTFSRETRKPVLFGGQVDYEFTKWLALRLRKEGMFIMTNSGPGVNLPRIAPWLDMVGAGETSADQPDSYYAMVRSTIYRKPTSFGDSQIGRDSAEVVERKFRKCLLFAISPGAFGFQRNPGIRAVFKEFTPYVKLLGGAGWEPVTYAWSSDSRVYVERFGQLSKLYFSLYNTADADADVELTVDAAALGRGEKVLEGLELLGKKELDFRETSRAGLQVVAVHVPARGNAIVLLR